MQNILNNGDIKLIDWEYAGMCDSLIDISMFTLYAGYNDDKLKELINHYFDDSPSQNELIRINAYMSLGGFLWYLWSLYKESIGIDFKYYRAMMFNYAKEYCIKALSMMKSNC